MGLSCLRRDVKASEHAKEEAFWSHIDDGTEEDDWFWDYFAHAERQWKE